MTMSNFSDLYANGQLASSLRHARPNSSMPSSQQQAMPPSNLQQQQQQQQRQRQQQPMMMNNSNDFCILSQDQQSRLLEARRAAVIRADLELRALQLRQESDRLMLGLNGGAGMVGVGGIPGSVAGFGGAPYLSSGSNNLGMSTPNPLLAQPRPPASLDSLVMNASAAARRPSAEPNKPAPSPYHPLYDQRAVPASMATGYAPMTVAFGEPGQKSSSAATTTKLAQASAKASAASLKKSAIPETTPEDEAAFLKTILASQSPSKDRFPIKLYRMIHEAEQEGNEGIVAFLPHGKAFAIHNEEAFVKDIMPRYFPGCRLPSFQKQLNLYGFHKITVGVHKGKLRYFHSNFLKGKPSLCTKIQRRGRGGGK